MIKKKKLTKITSRTLRGTAVRNWIPVSFVECLFSAHCHIDNMRLKHATPIITLQLTLPNTGSIARLLFNSEVNIPVVLSVKLGRVSLRVLFNVAITSAGRLWGSFARPMSSKTRSIMSITSNRSMAIWKDSLNTKSLRSWDRSRSSALCSNNNNRGGVRHRSPFKRPKLGNFLVPSLSPSNPKMIPMFTIKATI